MLRFWFKVTLSCLAALLFSFTAQASYVVNLTTEGANQVTSASGVADLGGTYLAASTAIQPTGTGYIDSFLQIKQTGNERGYSTSSGTPLDNLAPNQFNHSIQLKDIATVTIGGVVYRQFLLDINQNGQTDFNISLNQVQFFVSGGDVGTSYTLQDATDTQNAVINFSNATEVFRLSNRSALSATSAEIQVGASQGSGFGDMFLYVKSSVFGTDENQYVTLFSQFGKPTGAYSSNAGFEEWATVNPGVNPVPAPVGLVLALSGAPFLLAGRVIRRKLAAAAKA